jgi:hydroxymethylbilane synthase
MATDRAVFRLATRGSALAAAQAERVAVRLRAAHPGLRVVLVRVESSGDRDRASPVAALTESGAFVHGVQQAVLERRADAAVHSLKDLPTAAREGLVLAAVPERADPSDALVGADVEMLATGARVATGSPRRRAQVALIRPDLRFVELRGNVDTRLRRIGAGEAECGVLATAGLLRLGRGNVIVRRLGVEEMVPAPGQGALAVETAADDSASGELVAAIDDGELRAAVDAERELLARTGAGCRAALGALAEAGPGGIGMWVFVADGRGPRRALVERAADPVEAAAMAAKELGL